MISRYLIYLMKITFWHFDNSLSFYVMLTMWWQYGICLFLWSTESQLMWSRTGDDCLKTFNFIPNAIIINFIKSITQIKAWLFVFVGSRLLKAVTNYDNKWLQIARGEREISVKYMYILLWHSSQSSTTTAWVDRCTNWETAVWLNHLILWRKRHFGIAKYALTHKKFDIDTST